MELFSVHKSFNQSNLGEEKHQMLNLNRRLESYLSRVKNLEEENSLLAKEIQALRANNQSASSRRRDMEEELRHARLEVEAAWRDRVNTEFEIGMLSEQLQALDLQRQAEAQAQVEAKTKLVRSRKELDEEKRAQIWLKEKVTQLEHEMRHLIQTHEDDVAHFEAKLSCSKSSMPLTLAYKSHQMPNILELGHEFSQQATRVWQEAAEAYQGQLAQLEASLNQTRSRLTQVGQEKKESHLMLQALEKEIASAHNIKMHLENNMAQQENRYSKDIQELQEHLEGLDVEKQELGQMIEHILHENRGLMQAKMSLGLEVATYRTLLDSESMRGGCFERKNSITDAVFSPRGVKNNKAHLSASYKTTSIPSSRGFTGSKPKLITATPIWSKPITLNEEPKISIKSTSDTAKSEIPYPKILQNGAIENFRPQEVNETVTYAEPLSPPNELESLSVSSKEKTEIEKDCSMVGGEHPEHKAFDDSVESDQIESGLTTEPTLKEEVFLHQFNTANLTEYHVNNINAPSSVSGEFDNDVPVDLPAEKQDSQKPHTPIAAWEETKCVERDVKKLQEETSDSETDAVLDPNFESRTSSPTSEFEPEESHDDILVEDNAEEMKQEMSCSLESTNNQEVEEKLYPDGEEMDTWDSVIEKKVNLKKDDGFKTDERLQHAEPEEDISPKEQEHKKRETILDTETRQDNMASAILGREENDDGHDVAADLERGLLSDKEDDEEEDSQNVSVSWKTELESDSYAQDNTLADTRPLIRYKSDEMDGQAHVSHMDESESSDGEHEKRVEEGKSNRFGTMEDLCEEAEGEALDEDHDPGCSQIEDSDINVVRSVNEDATQMNVIESAEMIREVGEGYSDEDAKGLTRPMAYTNVDDEEELETNKLVEQELENLATDSYSAHFAQQQISEDDEMLYMHCKTAEVMKGQKEALKTEAEDMPSDHDLTFPTVTALQEAYFSDLSEDVPQRDTDEVVYYEEYEVEDVLGIKAENKDHSVSNADKDDHHTSLSHSLPGSDMKDTSEETKLLIQISDKDVVCGIGVEPLEASIVAQDSPIDVSEVPETAEWEVLENPSEVVEVTYPKEDHEKCYNVPESPERYIQDNRDPEQGVAASQEEPFQKSPESAPGVNEIFAGKDSAEVLDTNGKDEGIHGFFSSGVHNDFWLSSLKTGANYPSDKSRYEAAEPINEKQGFADDALWGNVDEPNVANKDPKADIDLTKPLPMKAEQKQIDQELEMCRRAAEGQFVHYEDSDIEGESWSSGEEPI